VIKSPKANAMVELTAAKHHVAVPPITNTEEAKEFMRRLANMSTS
jgi:hypothetical protein